MRIFLFIITVTVNVRSISRLFMSPKVRQNLYLQKSVGVFAQPGSNSAVAPQWRAQRLIPDSFPCGTNGADGERGPGAAIALWYEGVIEREQLAAIDDLR